MIPFRPVRSPRNRRRLCWLLIASALTAAPAAFAQQPVVTNPPALQAETPAAELEIVRRLMADGRFHDAEIELRRDLASDPQSPTAHYLLAYALLRQGSAKESLAEYTRAAALRTPSAEDLKNVGQDYALLDDLPDAAKWTTRALDMNRRDPELWYSLGRIRYTEKKYEEAEKCFRQTLVLAPRSVKAENNLGLALEGLNRSDDAVAAYRQAIAWQESGPPKSLSEQPLLNLAIVLIHRRQDAEARSLLIRAAAIAPNDVAIDEQFGQLCIQDQNYAEARTHLEAAVRRAPNKSNLHFLLGQTYRHLGMTHEAQAEFDAVARLVNPHAPAPPQTVTPK